MNCTPQISSAIGYRCGVCGNRIKDASSPPACSGEPKEDRAGIQSASQPSDDSDSSNNGCCS